MYPISGSHNSEISIFIFIFFCNRNAKRMTKKMSSDSSKSNFNKQISTIKMKSYKKERESIILKKEPEKTINFQQLSTISLLIMLIVKHNYSDLNQLCWSISHCFKSINKYQVVWILTLWSLIFLEIINLSIKPCQLKELN